MNNRFASLHFFKLLMIGTILVPVFVLGQAPSESHVDINVGATVESQNPFVTTNSASDVEETGATLNGSLVSLGQESSADVFFQYREQATTTWQETARQTSTTTGSFNETISGLSEDTAYEFRAAVEWGSEQKFGDILTFNTGEESPPSSPSPTPPGKVVFEGYAYPNAFVTIMKVGNVIGTTIAEEDGTFSKEITSDPGVYTFSVYATDSGGRQSVTNSFQVPVFSNQVTTVSGIFLSPTISAETEQAPQGEFITVKGEGFPGSIIRLFTDNQNFLDELTVPEDGKWEYSLDTSSFSEGEHSVRARSVLEGGEQSSLSESIFFTVLPAEEEPEPEPEPDPDPDPDPDPPVPPPGHPCPRGDLNKDGRVDLMDISIWVFYHETDNACADQNSDGIVNLVDLAIITFYWTE